MSRLRLQLTKLKLLSQLAKLSQFFNCIIFIMFYNIAALNSTLICVVMYSESFV